MRVLEAGLVRGGGRCIFNHWCELLLERPYLTLGRGPVTLVLSAILQMAEEEREKAMAASVEKKEEQDEEDEGKHVGEEGEGEDAERAQQQDDVKGDLSTAV